MRIEKILEVHANHVQAIANGIFGLANCLVDNKKVDFVYNTTDKSWTCITNNQLIPKNDPLYAALSSIILGASKLWSSDIKS